ncbi:hypothetical protein ACP70R_003986 [Stipagrostis hirtigluma subsp. patula]
MAGVGGDTSCMHIGSSLRRNARMSGLSARRLAVCPALPTADLAEREADLVAPQADRARGHLSTQRQARRRRHGRVAMVGLRISTDGFGASPLGHVFDDVLHEATRAAVRRVLDLGVNFFDTSPYYGGTVSESVLDDCLRHAVVPWGRVVVAIKCGPYKEGFDFTAEHITRSLDDSLAHLGLDYDIEFTNLDQDTNELLLQLCGCCLGYGLLL